MILYVFSDFCYLLSLLSLHDFVSDQSLSRVCFFTYCVFWAMSSCSPCHLSYCLYSSRARHVIDMRLCCFSIASRWDVHPTWWGTFSCSQLSLCLPPSRDVSHGRQSDSLAFQLDTMASLNDCGDWRSDEGEGDRGSKGLAAGLADLQHIPAGLADCLQR